jgi:hypothetical protein
LDEKKGCAKENTKGLQLHIVQISIDHQSAYNANKISINRLQHLHAKTCKKYNGSLLQPENQANPAKTLHMLPTNTRSKTKQKLQQHRQLPAEALSKQKNPFLGSALITLGLEASWRHGQNRGALIFPQLLA